MKCVQSFLAMLFSLSFCHGVTVKTSRDRYVALFAVGIDVSEMTSLSFKVQTCTYGQVILADKDNVNNNSVYINYLSRNRLVYSAICVGDNCNETSEVLIFTSTPLSLCQNPGALWISWKNGSIVFGQGNTVDESALISLAFNYTVAKVIVGSNATDTLDTWEFDIDTSEKTDPSSDSEEVNLTTAKTSSLEEETTKPTNGEAETSTEGFKEGNGRVNEDSENGTETLTTQSEAVDGSVEQIDVGTELKGSSTPQVLPSITAVKLLLLLSLYISL